MANFKLKKDIQTSIPDPDRPGSSFLFKVGSILDLEYVGTVHFEDEDGEWEIPLEDVEEQIPLDLDKETWEKI